jgi:hypothetical protein
MTESTHRLGLRLFCTNGTLVKDALDCWPDFPIVLRYGIFPGGGTLVPRDEDEIVAALQKPDRISMIHLTLTEQLLDKLATLTPKPFPTLEVLELTTQSEAILVLPDQSFCREAPRLHTLRTAKTAFLALPQLLSSAKNLVSLQLGSLPCNGFIPPDVLITNLSEMDSLQMFHIHFLSPNFELIPNPEETAQYLSKRVFLPALKYLEFHGAYEYLEYLLSGIDALVKYIYITFFNDLDFSHLPQLQQFITRLTKTQGFLDEATVCYSKSNISFTSTRRGMPLCLGLRISCRQFDWQVASLAEIYTQLRSPVIHPGISQLDLYAPPPFPDGYDEMDTSPFLNLFRSFDDVEILRVNKEIGSHIAHALAGNTELLKVREIHLEEHGQFASVQKALAPFITARQHSDDPVTLYAWSKSNHPPTGVPISPATPPSRWFYRDPKGIVHGTLSTLGVCSNS